jgi:hypothetical protein
MGDGWSGLKLKRFLERREREVGAKILTCFGEGNGARYYVTLARLHEHCPEFFSRREAADSAAQVRIAKLEEQIEKLEMSNRELFSRIERLERSGSAVDTSRRK